MSTVDENIILSEEEFKSLKELDVISGFDYPLRRHIYNILNKYPDQKKDILLNFESYLSDIEKGEYESFGILIDHSKLARDQDARNYLLIVDPVSEENMEAEITKFRQEYLPADAEPDFFVVRKNIETYEDMVYWNNLMLKYLPDSQPFVTHSKLKSERRRETNMQELLEEVVSVGGSVIDIKDDLRKVADAYNDNNMYTLNRLRDLENNFMAKYTGKEFLFCSDPSVPNLTVVAAYMFFKHNVIPQLDNNDTNSFLNHLSRLAFDPTRMLVEDQFKYLLELPDVMMMFNQGFEFLVFLNKSEMKFKARVSYIDANLPETSTVEQIDIPVDQLNIIPLGFEYPISGTNYNDIRSKHDELLKLLVILERKINKFSSTVDVTNSFFFEQDGVKYIGHVEEITFELPGLIYPIHDELTRVYHRFKLNEVAGFHPIKTMPGFKEPVKQAIIEVSKTLYQVKKIDIYRHEQALGLYLSHFGRQNSHPLKIDGVDFITIGLWWEETFRYRLDIIRRLTRFIDLQEFRKKSKYVGVFGGPHPLLREEFQITEEFLKE